MTAFQELRGASLTPVQLLLVPEGKGEEGGGEWKRSATYGRYCNWGGGGGHCTARTDSSTVSACCKAASEAQVGGA